MSEVDNNTVSPDIVAMTEHLSEETIKLAELAADASTNLLSLGERCGHEETSTDISNIAKELASLSQTLWRLYEAMSADPEQYTQSFNQDLAEIAKELHLVFNEIDDCSKELQQADPENVGVVAWMFKKGRVQKLQKHLEALKTTLIVMKLVLWHGKEYGTHNSPGRLAESMPHTMHEDRVILESVLAQNRNAIVDVHMLDSHDDKHKHISSFSSDGDRKVGEHYRKLSAATSVEFPPLPDILPSTAVTSSGPDAGKLKADIPSRRFSKRGVRLAVHSSILNMNTQEAPAQLKKKWIQESRAQNDQGATTLSKIPEAVSTKNLRQIALGEPLSDKEMREINEKASKLRLIALGEPLSEKELREMEKQQQALKPALERNMPSMMVECPSEEDGNAKLEEDFPRKRRASVKMLTAPLRKMMNKLSISHDSMEEANRGHGRLSTRSFQAPPLNTPDYEKEFENGV